MPISFNLSWRRAKNKKPSELPLLSISFITSEVISMDWHQEMEWLSSTTLAKISLLN